MWRSFVESSGRARTLTVPFADRRLPVERDRHAAQRAEIPGLAFPRDAPRRFDALAGVRDA